MLERVEAHLRDADVLDRASDLVLRGWPLDLAGLLRNADATRSRYSWRGLPFLAISVEVSGQGWTVDDLLAGSRLRTRSRYATAPVAAFLDDGFELLPTFAAPHYSLVLPSYDEASAQRVLEILGDVRRNPFFIGRAP